MFQEKQNVKVWLKFWTVATHWSYYQFKNIEAILYTYSLGET